MYTHNHWNGSIVYGLSAKTKTTKRRQFPACASPMIPEVHYLPLLHERHAPLHVKDGLPTKTGPRAPNARFRCNAESVNSAVNMTGRLSKVGLIAWNPTEAPPANLGPLRRLVGLPISSAQQQHV